MRIISGKHKGFRFPEKSLPHVRPTTDRAKESLFNVLSLRYDFDTIKVLDLYSGTGNISFEFWSRGCKDITAVEQNIKSIAYIRNISAKLEANIQLLKSGVVPYLKNSSDKFDLIFADPPYEDTTYYQLIEIVFERNLLRPGGVLILEHLSKIRFDHLRFSEKREYGQSTFSFFTFD